MYWSSSNAVCCLIDRIRNQAEEKQGGRKGRLLGVISLSDVLQYVIGNVGLGEGGDGGDDDDG